jgi:copper chaperone CopZ
VDALNFSRRSVSDTIQIDGMSCRSCAEKVQAALSLLPGVFSVIVDLPSGTAVVQSDPSAVTLTQLKRAITDAGYAPGHPLDPNQGASCLKPLILGFGAAIALLALYLGVITALQGFGHALDQLIQDRWFISVISAGFGIQVGLFAYLRQLAKRGRVSGMAASTGTSAVGMLACCAHHLSDVLPIVGVSGAMLFVNHFKVPLLWLGVASNLAGIVYKYILVSRQRNGNPAVNLFRREGARG